MPEDSPFELLLVVCGRPGLKTMLRNRSPLKRVYCYSMFWQPPLLELRAPDGATLRGQDQRIIMRPLDPMGRDSFHELGPGAVADLLEADIERSGEGGYSIRWGYQRFHELRPDRYGVVATMECTRRSWADEERQWHLEKDAWEGNLRSNEVEVELP